MFKTTSPTTTKRRRQLYLLTRLDNMHKCYDYYDCFVVAADNHEAAKKARPPSAHDAHNWPTDLTFVKVERVGTAVQRLRAGHIVCASYVSA